MKSKAEILSLLMALGSTADEVAAKLVSLGIKGDRNECRTCPIAQYLVSNGLEAYSEMKGEGARTHGLLFGVEASGYWWPLATHPQLTGVSNFILDFDRGQYPQCDSSL
jgi:hypothetical protein